MERKLTLHDGPRTFNQPTYLFAHMEKLLEEVMEDRKAGAPIHDCKGNVYQGMPRFTNDQIGEEESRKGSFNCMDEDYKSSVVSQSKTCAVCSGEWSDQKLRVHV